MALLKIHLERYPNQDSEQKYILSFIPEIHYNVKAFLESAIKALEIETSVQNLVMESEGYIMPHSLDAISLKDGGKFKIRVKQRKGSPKLINEWSAQKIPNFEEKRTELNPINSCPAPLIDEQSLSDSEYSTPKFSEKDMRPEIVAFEQKKKPKLKRARKSSSSSQQIQTKPKKAKKISKPKVAFPYVSQSSSSQSQQQLPRISSIKTKTVESKKSKKQIKKNGKAKQMKEVLSESSSPLVSEQSEQQQVSKPVKKVKLNKQMVSSNTKPKHIDTPSTAKSTNANISVRQEFQKTTKRKIIEANIQSSDQSSQQHKKDRFVERQTNNLKQAKSSPSNSRSIMIPPVLRNKIQKPNVVTASGSSFFSSPFKSNKEDQWVDITSEILKGSQKKDLLGFFQSGNLIRFKEIELDEVKFVPRQSQWIEGTISDINIDSGKISLQKVSQVGQKYRQNYEIKDINMLKPQINRIFASKQQLLILDPQKQSKLMQTNRQTPEFQQQQQQINQDSDKQKCSIQKFVCGQVNYYFSDKNYPTDLFMQMHANKDPEKYINVRFLLNFPKIKKVLKDQQKLFQYLVQDQKRNERNFQLNEQKRMVRKKQSVQKISKQVNQQSNNHLENGNFEEIQEKN